MPHFSHRLGEEMDVAAGIMAADAFNREAQPGDHGIKPMATAAAPELAGEGHRIHKRHRAHRQPVPETALPEKRHIEPLAIVGDQSGIAGKLRKSPQGLRRLRGSRDLVMGNPGQSRDEGRHPLDRAHKSLKPLALVPLPGPHLDAGDLDDVLRRGREAGGFEIENQISHNRWAAGIVTAGSAGRSFHTRDSLSRIASPKTTASSHAHGNRPGQDNI